MSSDELGPKFPPGVEDITTQPMPIVPDPAKLYGGQTMPPVRPNGPEERGVVTSGDGEAKMSRLDFGVIGVWVPRRPASGPNQGSSGKQ